MYLGIRLALGAREAGSPRPGQDGDPVSELGYIRSSRDAGHGLQGDGTDCFPDTTLWALPRANKPAKLLYDRPSVWHINTRPK